MSKILTNRIVVVIDRTNFGWEGSLSVDSSEASACAGPSADGVLDAVWSGTFWDEAGSEAMYRVD